MALEYWSAGLICDATGTARRAPSIWRDFGAKFGRKLAENRPGNFRPDCLQVPREPPLSRANNAKSTPATNRQPRRGHYPRTRPCRAKHRRVRESKKQGPWTLSQNFFFIGGRRFKNGQSILSFGCIWDGHADHASGTHVQHEGLRNHRQDLVAETPQCHSDLWAPTGPSNHGAADDRKGANPRSPRLRRISALCAHGHRRRHTECCMGREV